MSFPWSPFPPGVELPSGQRTSGSRPLPAPPSLSQGPEARVRKLSLNCERGGKRCWDTGLWAGLLAVGSALWLVYALIKGHQSAPGGSACGYCAPGTRRLRAAPLWRSRGSAHPGPGDGAQAWAWKTWPLSLLPRRRVSGVSAYHIPLPLLEPALPGAVPPSRGGSPSTQGHWLFPSPPPRPALEPGCHLLPPTSVSRALGRALGTGTVTPCPTEQGPRGPNWPQRGGRPAWLCLWPCSVWPLSPAPQTPGTCGAPAQWPRLHLPRLPLSSGHPPRVIWARGAAGVTATVANRPQRQR